MNGLRCLLLLGFDCVPSLEKGLPWGLLGSGMGGAVIFTVVIGAMCQVLAPVSLRACAWTTGSLGAEGSSSTPIFLGTAGFLGGAARSLAPVYPTSQVQNSDSE